jgi:hypothetical protein
MSKRKHSAKKRAPEDPQPIADRSAARGVPEETLQGPPARETVMLRDDREHTSSSPALAGGDVDADWPRADSVGEEAPGGTVATPDQSVVDDIGDALGVPRAPDEEVRPSSEEEEA